MTVIAQMMVETLSVVRIIGFDFVLDSKNAAWLIEINPHVTPICHLHLGMDRACRPRYSQK